MRKPHAETSALEWASAALGLALLLLVFVVIGRDALRSEGTAPPAIRVEAGNIVRTRDGFLVEFEAINSGGEAAAAVTVEGTLETPGEAQQTAGATLDYVAGGARVPGGLFFEHDPRGGRLTLRAQGYQQP